MSEEMLKLLTLRRLPGRLNTEQAAQLLGFMPHDIPVLANSKLLKPLGNPAQQAVKYFAACEIEKFARDQGWLGRATRAIYNFWTTQNKKRGTERSHATPTLIAA